MTGRETLVRHPLAIAGALITTVSAVVFIALAIAVLAGMFENPYAGLVVFVAIPAVFLPGLLLIPAGMWLQQRKLRAPPRRGGGWPVLDFARRVRRRALVVAALTAANVVIVLLAGYGGLHWMESPTFCGQVCHTPMQPQFTAWQSAPHARVACVSCHIGEGAERRSCTPSWPASGSSSTWPRARSEADPSGRRDASGRAGADLRQMPPARARAPAIASA